MMTRRSLWSRLAGAAAFLLGSRTVVSPALSLPRSGDVYARAGEWIVCENDHHIAQFCHTVTVGQLFSPSDIINWRQDEPKVGTLPLPVCAKCGAAFVTGPMVFRFKDGWRHSTQSRGLRVQS